MAFITLGNSQQLQIKVPSPGDTGWADVMRTDTFLKIAEHLHTGSGDGAQLGTGSLLADAITGAKIRLDNDEYIRARNAADSANINLIKVDANDDAYIDPDLAKLNLKNATYLTARNNADSADVNILRLTTSDLVEVASQVSQLIMQNNVSLLGRNNADSANINIAKVNTSDRIEVGAEVAVLNMKNNTYLTGRDQADSADINMIKVNATDGMEILNGRVELSGSKTLTDNTSVAADASIITLAANEAVEIEYKMVRGTDVVSGKLELEQSNADIIRSEVGDDVGVTFSLASDILKYVTTSTGNNVTITYNLIKK